MTSSNVTGKTVKVNAAKEWAEFDRLPPRIREVIRNSCFDYRCSGLSRDVKKFGVDDVVNYWMRMDASVCRDEWKKEWGAQAADYAAAQPNRRRADWMDGGTRAAAARRKAIRKPLP